MARLEQMNNGKCSDCFHFEVCKQYLGLVNFDEEMGNCKMFKKKIIRCKDCKYRTWFVPGYGCGNFKSPFYKAADEDVPIMTKPDDFCSYGEINRRYKNV